MINIGPFFFVLFFYFFFFCTMSAGTLVSVHHVMYLTPLINIKATIPPEGTWIMHTSATVPFNNDLWNTYSVRS